MQEIQTGQIEKSQSLAAAPYGSTYRVVFEATSPTGKKIVLDENVQDTTYANLVNNALAGTLSPGKTYKITDYQTEYTQPETGITKTGAVEELLVQATSLTEISKFAQSVDFPKDVIHFELLPFVGFRNATATSKGMIYYREDDRGNSAFFDFRTVEFARRETTSGGGDFVSYVDTGFAKQDFPTFDTGFDYFDNHIGSTELLPGFAAINEDLPNVVFKGLAIGNKIGDISYGMTFGAFCTSNTFQELNIGVLAGDLFSANSFKQSVNNAVIGSGFTRNNIGGNVLNLTIGDDGTGNNYKKLSNVTMGNSCSWNNVGDMSLVTLSDNFSNNDIVDGLFNVNFAGYLDFNRITGIIAIVTGGASAGISGNQMAGSISSADIEGTLESNIFTGSFNQSDIGAGGSITESFVQGSISSSPNINGLNNKMKCKNMINFSTSIGGNNKQLTFTADCQNVNTSGTLNNVTYTHNNTTAVTYASDATLADASIYKTVVRLGAANEYYYASASGVFTFVTHP